MADPRQCPSCRSVLRRALVDGEWAMGCVACGHVENLLTDAPAPPKRSRQPRLFRIKGAMVHTEGPVQYETGLESRLEQHLYIQLKAAQLPEPEVQYRPCADRLWRTDFAWPEQRLIVEVEGGVWRQGRHQRPLGFQQDIEKYNTLTVRGWRVLRFTREEIHDGSALRFIEAALDNVLRKTPQCGVRSE